MLIPAVTRSRCAGGQSGCAHTMTMSLTLTLRVEGCPHTGVAVVPCSVSSITRTPARTRRRMSWLRTSAAPLRCARAAARSKPSRTMPSTHPRMDVLGMRTEPPTHMFAYRMAARTAATRRRFLNSASPRSARCVASCLTRRLARRSASAWSGGRSGSAAPTARRIAARSETCLAGSRYPTAAPRPWQQSPRARAAR